MSEATSESAALISPVTDPKGVDRTYATFIKPSTHGSVNQEDEEGSKILSASGQHYVVYNRRWYIMLVFSFMCLLQAAAWNTWGPIADTGM